MKKKWVGLIIKLFIIIIILATVFVIYELFANKKENNFIKNIIENNINEKKDNSINDSIYGTYLYKNSFPKQYYINTNCALTSIDYYLVYTKNDYYLYKTSCLGTFFLSSGKIADIEKPIYDYSINKYKVNYNGQEYQKDFKQYQFVERNLFLERIDGFNLDYLSFLLDETEMSNKYYDFSSRILNLNFNSNLTLKIKDTQPKILIEQNGQTIYKKEFIKFNDVPNFKTFGFILAVLENNSIANKYSYNLIGIDHAGIRYNLKSKFPMKINNITLNYDDENVIVKYNELQSTYDVIVSSNKNLCKDNTMTSEEQYYHFIINIDYLNGKISDPVIKKIYKSKDGCSFYNSIIGG